MTRIADDSALREALKHASPADQRKLAAGFVQSVQEMASDERIGRLAAIAVGEAGETELADALKSARRLVIDTHTRCGAEGDWDAQTDYFIARALVQALSAEQEAGGKAAWQAAMSCRMARTCQMIDSDETAAEDAGARERHKQHEIVSNTLKQVR